jgi:hypothetical protein
MESIVGLISQANIMIAEYILVAGLDCEFLASQWESLIIGLVNNGTTGGI